MSAPAKNIAAKRRADDALIRDAIRLLEARVAYGKRIRLSAPGTVRDYLRLTMTGLEHEIFAALWVDAQNCLIEREVLFRGTLTQTSVYPREVVKRALAHNAAGVIVAHNHPSGLAEPSAADEQLTRQLKEVLALVDVRLLDHIVVGGARTFSFVEKGLL